MMDQALANTRIKKIKSTASLKRVKVRMTQMNQILILMKNEPKNIQNPPQVTRKDQKNLPRNLRANQVILQVIPISQNI